MPITRNELTDGLYFTGLIILVVGLPLSMSLMSFGQLALFLSWIFSGDLPGKLKRFFSNPVAILIVSVFFMHLIGMVWSSNQVYGWNDIRIKIPLLLLPLIISTSKVLPFAKIKILLEVFILAVLTGTLVSMAVLTGLINRPVNDIRDISMFISHIRFGLLICMAIFILFWFLIQPKKKHNHVTNGILLLLMIWLVAFLVILEALTGLVILLSAALLGGTWLLLNHPRNWVKSLLLLPVFLLGMLVYEISRISSEVAVTKTTDLAKLDPVTPRGNPYAQETPYDDTENGNPIWIYICPAEIDSAWPKRSRVSIKGQDRKGQVLYYTLIRYLSSKGLRKDADGIQALTDEDILAVENGYTNYRFTKTSNLYARLYQLVWEFHHYRRHGSPGGHSLMQRLEFWKTGWHIFTGNPWFGVGTGDVQDAFTLKYEELQSKLPVEQRHRAHNQFLTFALTFGGAGLLLFLLSLFIPWFVYGRKSGVLLHLFFITALLSFIHEDTLETQAGVTFFAFFNAFLLFGNADKGFDSRG